MEKTHWKKVVSDPNFIGEGDFQEGEEKVATIKSIAQSETVVTAEGKSKKAVVHFEETGIKPMILNVARSKAIEKVCGSGYFEDWPGTKIQLFVEHGIKAFGDVVNAVRVRPFKPKEQKHEPVPPCADCGGEIKAAMGKSAEFMAAYTTRHYGVPLCADCAQIRKNSADAVAAEPNGETQENETEDSEDGTVEQQ